MKYNRVLMIVTRARGTGNAVTRAPLCSAKLPDGVQQSFVPARVNDVSMKIELPVRRDPIGEKTTAQRPIGSTFNKLPRSYLVTRTILVIRRLDFAYIMRAYSRSIL